MKAPKRTMAEKSHEQIVRDVESDWSRPRDQATIRRRWPKLDDPKEIQAAEVRMRMFLQSLPTTPNN